MSISIKTQNTEHRTQNTDELANGEWRMAVENSNNQCTDAQLCVSTNNHLQKTENRKQNTETWEPSKTFKTHLNAVTIFCIFPLFLFLIYSIPCLSEETISKTLSIQNLGFSINFFGLDEDNNIRSRLNEYRDIDSGGVKLSNFSFSNLSNSRLNYALNLKNIGYQDSSANFSAYSPLYSFRYKYDKILHHINLQNTTNRDRQFSEFTFYPLSNLNGSFSYSYEEKDGTLSAAQSQLINQKVDELKFTLNGTLPTVSASLNLTDSKMEHPSDGYEADGISALVTSKNSNLSRVNSFCYDKKQYTSNRTSLLPGELETEQISYNTLYSIDDYFLLNAGVFSVETNNSNSGAINFDKKTYKAGFDFKTSQFRVGYNFKNQDVDYTNAQIQNKETDSSEVYFKSKPTENTSIRATYKTEERRTNGVKFTTLSNSEQLAAKKITKNLNFTLSPISHLLVSGNFTGQKNRFLRVSPIGVDSQNFHSQITTFQYQYSPHLSFYGNHYFQKSTFNGIMPLVLSNGSTQYSPFQIPEDSSTYSLGFSAQLSEKSDIDCSYSQGDSRIGDYLATNKITERNISVSYNYAFKNSLDLTISLTHNSYFDYLDTGVSGVSDFVDMKISKKITF